MEGNSTSLANVNSWGRNFSVKGHGETTGLGKDDDGDDDDKGRVVE